MIADVLDEDGKHLAEPRPGSATRRLTACDED
jgi:hypothetical protein